MSLEQYDEWSTGGSECLFSYIVNGQLVAMAVSGQYGEWSPGGSECPWDNMLNSQLVAMSVRGNMVNSQLGK